MTKWQFVPVEPTPEMIGAWNEDDSDEFRHAYRAMLAAAPEAPAVPRNEPVFGRMGIPECGGVSCSPNDHHPLCGMSDRAPAVQQSDREAFDEALHQEMPGVPLSDTEINLAWWAWRAGKIQAPTALGDAVQATANARRIVAAVNACATMPTDDLEEMVSVGGNIRNLAEFADHLRLQRDKLMAALESLVNEPQDITTPAYQNALAALAATE